MSGGRPRGPAATAPPRKEHAIKILVHSNAPWSQVGYGIQTALFAPRIRDLGHDVAISTFFGLGGRMQIWNDMNIYPGDDAWGNRTMAAAAAHHADGDPFDCLILTLMDVWVLESKLQEQLRIASWVPVDHDPVPPRVQHFFERTAATPIAMSRFGEHALRDVGLDPLYVPHGVDTEIFQSRRDDLAGIREMLDVPEDAFVVGMVGANKGNDPSRKAFPEAFEAFSRFHKTHPNAYLYMHCERMGVAAGLNLIMLADLFGIPQEAIRWAPQYELEIGFDQRGLSYLYSGMDVLLCPSYGEGFGIPLIEAQACGTPVIVTDWTAMPELVGAGWKVHGTRWYHAAQGSFFKIPSVDGIVDALEKAYATEPGSLGEQAREFALQYDVETVMRDYWVPVLEQLDRPREVGPLPELRSLETPGARRFKEGAA